MCAGISKGRSALCVVEILSNLMRGIVRDTEVDELERKYTITSGANLNTEIRSLEIILLIQGVGNWCSSSVVNCPDPCLKNTSLAFFFMQEDGLELRESGGGVTSTELPFQGMK